MAKNKKKKNEKKQQKAAMDAAKKRLTERRADASSQVDKLMPAGTYSPVSTPERIASLDTGVSALGGQSIAAAQDAYDRSLVADPYMTDALTRMQGGLEGIMAPENQALLEQGRKEITADTQNQLRALRSQMGAYGNIGGAYGQLAAKVKGSEANRRASQMSELIASNVAEKGRRLTEYGNQASSVYGLTQQAQQSALSALTGVQQNEANRQADAAKSNVSIAQQNIENAQGTERYNAEQAAKQKEAELDIYYGEQGIQQSTEAAEEERQYRKKMLNIANKGVR